MSVGKYQELKLRTRKLNLRNAISTTVAFARGDRIVSFHTIRIFVRVMKSLAFVKAKGVRRGICTSASFSSLNMGA